MLPSGAIVIGQPTNGATSLPFLNFNQPLVYIRNPTTGLSSGYEVSPQQLQTTYLFHQNASPFHIQQPVLTSPLQPAVQVLPTSAFHQLNPSFQPNTLAYIPSHQQQVATKRKASDGGSPSTSSNKSVEIKKPKLENSTTSRRVLHFTGLPCDVTKSEIIKLSSIAGGVAQVIIRGDEAFVEMTDPSSTQSLLAFYNQKSLTLRNHLIQVQLSDIEQVDDLSSQDEEECTITCKEANSNQDVGGKSSVLLVSVENVIYPVTVDLIKKIFYPYGHIIATATFTTTDSSHLLIEFIDKLSAEKAKKALNGHCMYRGGNRLKVEYSNMTTLEPQQTPSNSIGYTSFDPAQLVHPLVFEAPLQQPLTILNHSNLIAKTKELIPLGAASIIEPKFMTHYSTPINQVLLPQKASLLSMGNVLLVSNLEESKVSPDSLFTLFGVYGDVIRVKIMFNKKDTALIQFNDAIQAQTALFNLDKLKLWGKVIKVAHSKNISVQMPKDRQPGASLTKDYKNSPLHRFKKPNSKNFSNIFPPSSTLHLSNIPSTSKETLTDLFKEYGTVVGFKFFSNVVSANRDCKMALMQMSTVEEAAGALIGLHNHQLAETTHLRVSFSKSSVVPQPAQAEQDNKEQNETDSATQISEIESILQ